MFPWMFKFIMLLWAVRLDSLLFARRDGYQIRGYLFSLFSALGWNIDCWHLGWGIVRLEIFCSNVGSSVGCSEITVPEYSSLDSASADFCIGISPLSWFRMSECVITLLILYARVLSFRPWPITQPIPALIAPTLARRDHLLVLHSLREAEGALPSCFVPE